LLLDRPRRLFAHNRAHERRWPRHAPHGSNQGHVAKRKEEQSPRWRTSRRCGMSRRTRWTENGTTPFPPPPTHTHARAQSRPSQPWQTPTTRRLHRTWGRCCAGKPAGADALPTPRLNLCLGKAGQRVSSPHAHTHTHAVPAAVHTQVGVGSDGSRSGARPLERRSVYAGGDFPACAPHATQRRNALSRADACNANSAVHAKQHGENKHPQAQITRHPALPEPITAGTTRNSVQRHSSAGQLKQLDTARRAQQRRRATSGSADGSKQWVQTRIVALGVQQINDSTAQRQYLAVGLRRREPLSYPAPKS
jgi:hypothetical protein